MPNDRAMELSAGMGGIDIGIIVIVVAMTAGAVYALILLKKKVYDNNRCLTCKEKSNH